MKNKDLPVKIKKKKKRLPIAVAAVVLLLIAASVCAVFYFYPGAPARIKDMVSGVLSRNDGEPVPETAAVTDVPLLKLYSPQSPAVAPDAVTPANLKNSGGTYNTEGGPGKIYDGDPSSCAVSATGSVTLDAGKLKALSYIRYIPDVSSQEAADSCVGTKFLASKDNNIFVELGEVMPDANGDITPDWHTVLFSGYGMYRYFRVEFAPDASLGEVEWMCDDGIINTDKDGKEKLNNTDIELTAFDAAEEFDGRVALSVYSRNKVMRRIEVGDFHFVPGEYAALKFNNLDIELGDYIIVDVYDLRGMRSVLPSPLEYRYTEASSNLKMANIYSDNMMFQADTDLIISGKAPCGSVVEAEIEDLDSGEIYAASGIASGVSDWEANFGAFPNGGHYDLRVFCGDEELEYKNITFGDIWVFAGQSNMEFYLCGEKEGEEYLKTAQGKSDSNCSDIRMINLYNIGLMGAAGEIDDVPLNDWNGYWSELTTDRASYLSAIAYYFARGIYERYGRNVGIVSVAVGDTEINKWYPRGEKFGSFTGTDGRLYNNRIYPFTKQKIKGVLWYQGEADQYRTNMSAGDYADAMAGLINSYREKWNDPTLPFYYVQLARYGVKDESEIREGQRIALQRVASSANLGMFSLLDIIGTYDQGSGCARTDIHPWQKKLVAERFLDITGHDIYGDEKCYVGGPSYKSMAVYDDCIELTFEHTGSLRVMDKESYADSECDEKISNSMTDTNELHEFYIAGEDGRFYPARAEIENDKVVVYSDEVAAPKNVMYAWGAYPEMPNLTDDTGLPAFTFNTMNGSEWQ